MKKNYPSKICSSNLDKSSASFKAISILKKVQDLGVRFVICGGYYLRKFRPVHDFDILVHPDDWNKLISSVGGHHEVAPSGSQKYSVLINDFEIEFFWEGYPAGFDYLSMLKNGYDTDENGFKCWTKAQTIKWKKRMDRPKDKRDLILLESSGHGAGPRPRRIQPS
jgi:hypothetical protein